MITASNLTDRITILAPRTDRDAYGAQQTAYIPLRKVWANVKFSKGSRALDSGEMWMQNSIVVTTRIHKELTEYCRLEWDGKTYQIDSYNRSRTDGSITITASKIDTGNPTAEASIAMPDENE